MAKKQAVVSEEPNQNHIDMMGRPILQNDVVLAVHNNRPFPFTVVKLNKTNITVKPAIAWRKRGGSIPKPGDYRREGWNVYVIPKEDLFMYNLSGNR